MRDWVDGPVRYLMSKSERKRFFELETPPERLAFIQLFWSRRDPDPRTPTNELRIEFWRRVADANRLYGVAGTPGWKTDRGKIYILLGPPDDIDTKEYYDVQDRNTAARGLIRWHYTSGRRLPRTNFVIAFARGNDDDFHLTDDPKLNSPYFDVTSPLDQQRMYVGNVIYDQIPYAGGVLSTAMDLGRVQEAPPEPELVRGIVNAEGFIGSFHTDAGALIVARADGPPVLAITVALRRSEIAPAWDGTAESLASRFSVSASIVRGAAAPLDVGEVSFVAEPHPAADQKALRFQALVPLEGLDAGGPVSFSAVVLDRLGGGAGSARVAVDVPKSDPGSPQFTGPVLADTLLQGQDLVPSGRQAYRFGEAVVVPHLSRTYTSDDPFALFLEILPPRGSTAPVTLTWSFERRAPGAKDAEPWGKPGRLENARGTRGWELKPGALPLGSYTARFTAVVEGAPPVERTVSFDVIDKN